MFICFYFNINMIVIKYYSKSYDRPYCICCCVISIMLKHFLCFFPRLLISARTFMKFPLLLLGFQLPAEHAEISECDKYLRNNYCSMHAIITLSQEHLISNIACWPIIILASLPVADPLNFWLFAHIQSVFGCNETKNWNTKSGN